MVFLAANELAPAIQPIRLDLMVQVFNFFPPGFGYQSCSKYIFFNIPEMPLDF